MSVIQKTVDRALFAAHSGNITDEPWDAPKGGDRTEEDSLIDNGPDVEPSARYGYPVFQGGKLSATGVAAALGRARTHEPSIVPHLERIDDEIKAHKGTSRVATSADETATSLSGESMAPEKSVLCQSHREQMLSHVGKHKDNESMPDHDLVEQHLKEYDDMKNTAMANKEGHDDMASKATALSADVQRLESERDAAKQEAALALSGDPQGDPLSIKMMARALKTEEEQTIAAGIISQAGISEMRKLFYANGQPNRIALSATPEPDNVLYSAIMSVLRKFPGHAIDPASVGKVAAMATAEGNPALALNADGTPKQQAQQGNYTLSPAQQEALRANAGLPPVKKTA